MDGFRFTHEIEVRFRDLDLLGHVNNAVYVTYLEVARTQYYGDVLEMGFGEADDVDFNVVNVEVDFRRPIEFEDKVEVGVRTVDVGESSMTTEYEVEVDGELAAEASSVQVAVDDDGRPTRVPDSWRERFREYEDGSQATKASSRVRAPGRYTGGSSRRWYSISDWIISLRFSSR